VVELEKVELVEKLVVVQEDEVEEVLEEVLLVVVLVDLKELVEENLLVVQVEEVVLEVELVLVDNGELLLTNL
jgi:hypothetical protein